MLMLLVISGEDPAATTRRVELPLLLLLPLASSESRGAERREFVEVVGGLGALVSLHSGQLRMAAETVSLMRTQWYFSAMDAVVLLMPP